MSTRNHTLGGSQSARSSNLRFGFAQIWLWTSLLIACGGKPGVDQGNESAATGGAGATTFVPSAGTGPILTFSGGSFGTNGTTEAPSICGNGKLESKELCDDGNTLDGDGCSADCTKPDPHYDCSNLGQPCVKWVICGDSKLEGDEICDDGNLIAGDGCSADCSTVEPGFACPKPGKPCVSLPKCGNGVRERGEGCDDGQAVPTSGDGCSATCQLEAGFICTVPGKPCVKETCGDGNLTPNEQCDDANKTPGDGCSDRCLIETGWRCSSTGCSAMCGDGLVVGIEQCDDGNHNAGDGCSAACLAEPFFTCVGQPSLCTSTIVCGNGVREPGEICDPPGKDGCLSGCKTFATDYFNTTTVCGNAVIELGEGCDPPAVGAGCSAICQVEDGWICPRPNLCSRQPVCGDGQVDLSLSEACDDGNATANDGCTACKIDAGWDCAGLKPSKCTAQVCGDGLLASNEECDDKNVAANDGCTNCKVDPGWVCPVVGTACRARCGDNLVTGTEQCDDGNLTNGDGCNAGCRIEPGYDCPSGKNCKQSVCGNGGTPEAGEGCDDGNKVAGDGCGPTCQKEPTITVGPNPKVNLTCGDGLLTTGEECDDGNLTNGDGCSLTCQEEPGFDCKSDVKLPTSVDFRVTYRDFKSANATTAGGHPDFQYKIVNSAPGIAGTPCNKSNPGTCGRLDADGKPQLALTGSQATTGIRDADTYGLFYRDINAKGVTGHNGAVVVTPFVRTLTLTQTAAGSPAYSFLSTYFFPLGATEGYGRVGAEVPACSTGTGLLDDTSFCDRGCDATCQNQNFGFTTELRYFFQYRGGETLTFQGDDDVWVFINGGLAVDIGGVHQQLYGRVVLGDDGSPTGSTDSNCSVQGGTTLPDPGSCYDANEQADSDDVRFGLTKGGVYEIVFFHAERHTSQSNFRLTLSGFLAPRSYCDSICGDGILVAGEVCDDGANNADNVSGRCNKSCTQLAYCGDNVVQSGEQCDNGRNTDLYVTGTRTTQCAPGCVLPPTCGDGVVQGSEQCDNGAANDDASYGLTSCTTKCQFGGYCGDGIKNGTEVCDAGPKNGSSYGEGSCGYDCKSGPYFCGDGVRNGSEECDEGPVGGPHCSAACKLVPYCGDGVKSEGEQCDYGKFASTAYGSCTTQCLWSSYCGDAIVDAPNEECDNGTAANLGGYGGCTATCNLGPRCGDGLLQADKGEQCDNGYNQDTYLYVATACGRNCLRPPSCGDGSVMPGYELCDNGAANSDTTYEGCNTQCEWGPYCGDGKIDPQGGETCDNGRDNVIWGKDSSACGLDCKPAPYCGDGERNGPEQCDLGTANNTGAYGTCNPDCTLPNRCGDGVVQANEQCDAGPLGSLDCTAKCERRGTIL